jgi:hypothetical protein
VLVGAGTPGFNPASVGLDNRFVPCGAAAAPNSLPNEVEMPPTDPKNEPKLFRENASGAGLIADGVNVKITGLESDGPTNVPEVGIIVVS